MKGIRFELICCVLTQAGQVKRLEREVAALNAELAKANSIKNIKFLRKGTQNTSASYRASKAFQVLTSACTH
jgi:hypothetical protein